MLNPADLAALTLSLKLATATSIILLVVGLPLAWWLSRTQSRIKPVIEALVALPLILPPTVLGFYLLIALGSQGPVGQFWIATFGQPLAFSFSGLLIGSLIYSLPFVVQPLHNGFSQFPQQHWQHAMLLGAAPLNRFITLVLPACRVSIINAAVLGFAHTLGEFGVVLMIGGNIPSETQVLAIALYDHVEALNYGQAHQLAALLLATSFLVLIGLYAFNRPRH